MTTSLPNGLGISSQQQSVSSYCCSGVGVGCERKQKKMIALPTTFDEISATDADIEELTRSVIPNLPRTPIHGLGPMMSHLCARITQSKKRRQSERAALIFRQFLVGKFGEEVTSKTLDQSNWGNVKKKLTVVDIYAIRNQAEQLYIIEKVAAAQSGGVIRDNWNNWTMVQDGNWQPNIRLQGISGDSKNEELRDFDPKEIERKLMNNTRANPEQIENIVRGVKDKVLQHSFNRIVIPSTSIDSILVRIIAEKGIVLKSLEGFNQQRIIENEIRKLSQSRSSQEGSGLLASSEEFASCQEIVVGAALPAERKNVTFSQEKESRDGDSKEVDPSAVSLLLPDKGVGGQESDGAGASAVTVDEIQMKERGEGDNHVQFGISSTSISSSNRPLA